MSPLGHFLKTLTAMKVMNILSSYGALQIIIKNPIILKTLQVGGWGKGPFVIIFVVVNN